MRVSTSQIYSNQQRLANLRLHDYVQAQRQVASGKRIEQLSDDPAGSIRLLNSKSVHRAIEQYDANLSTAKDYFGTSESTYSEVTTLLNRAYNLALQGANESHDDQTRRAMAGEVASIMQQFVRLGNAQGSHGQYLFAGQKSDAPPFKEVSGVLNNTGDDNPVRVEVGPNAVMQVNIAKGSTFVNAYAALEQLRLNLEGSNQSALSGISVGAMRDQLRVFNELRSETGNGLRTIEDLKAQNERRLSDVATAISEIEDVDMIEAISNLQQAETAYQAALQVSAQTFRLSLLDYIR